MFRFHPVHLILIRLISLPAILALDVLIVARIATNIFQ